MCGDTTCKRKPPYRCTHQMNSICCEKQGKNCHFHHISKPAKPSKTSSGLKYNLSSPHILQRIFSDFARNVRHVLKFSKNDNELQLDRNIESAGLTYEEPRTPGDGNCMFHALAAQLRIAKGINITHTELRARVVTYLAENINTPDGSQMEDWIENRNWDEYLDHMRRDGVWGDEITLIAVANMFTVEITIISSLPGNSVRILTPAGGDPRNMPTLLLGHLLVEIPEICLLFC